MLSSGVIKCHRLRRGGSPVSRRYCRLKYATSAYPSADAIPFKPPGSRGQALHQDNFYLRAEPGTCVAAWMALDPCDEENGCLQVVPGTQDLPLLCIQRADTTQSFTDTTTGAGHVDVDLEAGDSPLDLAFDDAPESGASGADDIGAALDFNLETSDERPAPKAAQSKPAAKPTAKPTAKPMSSRDLGGDSLDIGAQTAAGLEAALFAADEGGIEIDGSDTDIGDDALAVTQESPTIERARPATTRCKRHGAIPVRPYAKRTLRDRGRRFTPRASGPG